MINNDPEPIIVILKGFWYNNVLFDFLRIFVRNALEFYKKKSIKRILLEALDLEFFVDLSGLFLD